jgi:hypothetical protein
MKNYTIPKAITKLNLARKTLALFAGLLCFINVSANPAPDADLGPWALLLYGGGTAKQVFGDVMLGKYTSFGEVIYAAELAYTLDQNNLIRRFFKPVFDVVQLAGNVAYRHDYTNHDNVKEGNLYLIWRFSRFPWGNYLKNSVAIGDGISYDSHPPFADIEPGRPANEYARLLNYLLLEVTFALPSHPEWELAFRVHHRCTAWGTFSKNANAGSTNVGIGLRYYF